MEVIQEADEEGGLVESLDTSLNVSVIVYATVLSLQLTACGTVFVFAFQLVTCSCTSSCHMKNVLVRRQNVCVLLSVAVTRRKLARIK